MRPDWLPQSKVLVVAVLAALLAGAASAKSAAPIAGKPESASPVGGKAKAPTRKPPITSRLLDDGSIEHSMLVTASAYSADDDQTDDSEDVAAWGDPLTKKTKAIAVSRDLLEMGLGRGTVVQIRGRKGDYVVLDKMHPRWKKSIDIFMTDEDTAIRWGRRKVRITWTTKPAAQLIAVEAPSDEESAAPVAAKAAKR
jgi:3D (Asp-Asp-Asp) domain-containing protein